MEVFLQAPLPLFMGPVAGFQRFCAVHTFPLLSFSSVVVQRALAKIGVAKVWSRCTGLALCAQADHPSTTKCKLILTGSAVLSGQPLPTNVGITSLLLAFNRT
jgi:hypothetical protein